MPQLSRVGIQFKRGFCTSTEPADPQVSNLSSFLFSLQMTHNLKWTSNPVQRTTCEVRRLPHAAAATTSSWAIQRPADLI